jgi:hypothetical protein
MEFGVSSMTDQDPATSDTFITSRYAGLVENQSCTPGYTTLIVDGMDIISDVLLLVEIYCQSITQK